MMKFHFRPGWHPGELRNAMLILFLACIGSLSAQAQQFTLEGTVVDSADGGPIPGVSVKILGAETGTSTGPDGGFSLEAPESQATLVISFLGYATREVQAQSGQPLTVRMSPDNQSLDQVVVIGYGSKRKRDITSAVSVIDMEKIKDRPVSNINNLMLGQAPGVVVKQNSGTPGEELDVKIRGVSSLGAGSDPLFVIDGFAMGTSAGRNLNAADVESITVLKDAASTAIYGARGSNGVVLITTKTASQDELSLNFSANYGVQNVPMSRRVEMMNGPEFAQFKKESFIDKIRYFEDGREPSLEEIPEDFRHPEQTKYSTDWMDAILNNNAPFQDYNITLASGKGLVKSLVSVNYLNQEGAIIETGFERFNVRANLRGDITENISFGWNIAGAYFREDFTQSEGRDAVIGSALWADPREPIYNEDGSFNDYIGGHDGIFGIANPVQELVEMERNQNNTDLITNGFVEVRFLKNFTFRSAVNARLINGRMKAFRPSTLAGRSFDQPPPREAYLDESSSQLLNVSTDQVLNYERSIGDHDFSIMAGYSAQEETEKGLTAGGDEFPDDIVRFLNAAERVDAGSTELGWSMLAYIGRVNYSFKDKYLFSATFRREGSSRFGLNNKWGNFPAVSLGWRVSDEPFMENLDWLTDLKLRGSWGVTGNNDIGNYSSLAVLNASNYILGGNFASGQVLGAFANANLGWEQSNQTNIGIDASLIRNKLYFTAEYYHKTTKDMLLPIEIPSISGFTTTFSNIGEVENKGLEFALGYQTSLNDLNLYADFNIAFNRNKVLAINGQNDEIRNGGLYSPVSVSRPGRPIGMLHGFKVMGIFNTEEEIDAWAEQDGAIPGVYKFQDTNGDGVISYDHQDMVEIGNPHPKFLWGFTLGGDYRNFDLNLLFTGAQGYDLYRQIEATSMNMDGVFNVLASAKNRWRSAEMPGDGVGATTNTWKWERESNSRYIYDGSHAWLKNLTLGYTIPSLKNTRVFFSADNLLLITNYPGNNPDVDQRKGIQPGVDDETYPVPRTFSIGASVKF